MEASLCLYLYASTILPKVHFKMELDNLNAALVIDKFVLLKAILHCGLILIYCSLDVKEI